MGRFSFRNAPRRAGVKIFRDGKREAFENYRTLGLVGPSIQVFRPRGHHAKPKEGNSLAERHPHIASEWHPKWNNGVKPTEISWSSNYLFYWRCVKGHQWVATLNSRTSRKSHGCPCCSKREVASDNNLAIQFPDHAAEWHPTANGDLYPEDVSPYTHQSVFWKRRDPPFDSWEAPVSHRTVGSGTGGKGFRSRLKGSSVYEALIFWQMKHFFRDVRNRFKVKDCELDIAIPTKKLGIEYDSYYYHKNKAAKDIKKIHKIERAGWRVLRVRQHGLKKERADDLVLGAREQDHYKWRSIERIVKKVALITGLNKKTNKYLKEKKLQNLIEFRRSVIHIRNVPFENSLLGKYPDVARYWDNRKNYPLTARDVSARDGNSYGFRCPMCGDGFLATPSNMVRSQNSRSRGCLNCTGRKVTRQNNLKASFPELVKNSWDFNGNRKKPEDFADSSNKYAYWVCRHCGKSVKRSINSVTANQGKRAREGYFVCHKCKGQEMREAGANALIAEAHRMHPILQKEWDTKYNKDLRLKNLVRVQARKELGWICSLCGGRFCRRIETRIKNFRRGVHGCPVCRYSRSMEKKARTLQTKYES
jgi:very-short-patch-repair endonuclease